MWLYWSGISVIDTLRFNPILEESYRIWEYSEYNLIEIY